MRWTSIFSGIVLFIVSATLQGAEISVNQASRVAKNLCWAHGQGGAEYHSFSIQHSFSRIENGVAIYHVFKIPGKTSYIIVSAEDNAFPVLAYSFESDLPADTAAQIPPVRDWLDNYKNQIVYIREHDLMADATIQHEWALYMMNEAPELDVPTASVSPMSDAMWNQDDLYNNLCPSTGGVHPAGPDGHVYAGCVATAMAIAMKYWNFPAIGTGSHTYTDPNNPNVDPSYGTLSATFNYPYNWLTMPNSLTANNTDVATLIYDAGVAVNMNYAFDESGATQLEAANAFKNYFYYSESTTLKDKFWYLDNDWTDLMKGELNAGRLVVYGSHGPDGGHSYVMDGYNDSTNTHLYFHFNWGWSGNENGWYRITNLNPNPYTLNDGHQAIVNLEPKPVNLEPIPGPLLISGTNLTMSLSVFNNSIAPAASSVVAYYASANTTITSSDHLIGLDYVSYLTPSQISVESTTADLNSFSIAPGNYYLGFIIDYVDNVNESNENDNDYCFSTQQITKYCSEPTNVAASDGTYDNKVRISWSEVEYATHYRVYRGNSSMIVALGDWTNDLFYNDNTALPGHTYTYYVKAATSSSGEFSGTFSAGDSGYVALQQLSEDVQYTSLTSPRYYSYLHSSPSWSVVGVRPTAAGKWDINMYDDANFGSIVASSSVATDSVNFVVADGNHASLIERGIGISRIDGTGGVTVEYEGGNDSLSEGFVEGINWPAGDVVEIWDVILSPGTYRISLSYNGGAANLDLGFLKTPSGFFTDRSGLFASSTNLGSASESFLVTVNSFDTYGLIVWANDNNSANYNLEIEKAGTWLGIISTKWRYAANWSADYIPTSSINVTIPAGCSHYPVIALDSANCYNLTMEAGTSLQLGSNTLRVFGNMNCSGLFNVSSSTSKLYVLGNITWNPGASVTANSNSQMFIYGNWIFEAAAHVNITSGYVDFRGSDASFIRSYDSLSALFNVRNNKTVPAELGVSALSTANLHVNGDIYNYQDKLLSSYSDHRLIIGGSLQNLDGNFHFDNGAVEFSGNPMYSLKPTPGSYFNDLILHSNTGTSLTLDNTYSDSLVINNDLTIQSGTLNPSNMNIVVEGNWDNQSFPAGFTSGGSTVHFMGSQTYQDISSENFNNLIINKTSGGFIRMQGGAVNCTQYNWTAGGVWVVAGSFTAADLLDNGIYGEYHANIGATINLTNTDGPVDFNGDIFITGGTFNVSGGTTISRWPWTSDASLFMSGGTLDFKNQGLIMYPSGLYAMTYAISGGKIRTAGSLVANDPAFHPLAGALEFYGSTANTLSAVSGAAFNHLEINKGATGTLTANTNLNINGDFRILSGSFIAPTVMNVAGNWTNSIGESAFNEGSGTVIFDSTLSKFIFSDENFYNLSLNKNYPGYDGLILNDGKKVGVLNALSILDGTLELNSNSILDVDGNITINAEAGINAGGPDTNIVIKCGGNWINMNTTPTNTINGFLADGSTVYFDKSGLQTITTNAPVEVFNNLVIDKNGSILNVNDNIITKGKFTLNSGQWKNNVAALTHKFYGDFTVAGFWNFTDNPDAIIEFKGLASNTISNTGAGYPVNIKIRKQAWISPAPSGNPFAEPFKIVTAQATDLLSNAVRLNSTFRCDNLSIDTGRVEANGHILTVSNSLAMNSVEGSMDLNSGAILELAGSGLSLNGGSLKIIGSAANNARVRSFAAGSYYPFSLTTGHFAAKHAVFSGMDQMGVAVFSGVTVDPFFDFDSCAFREGMSGGVLLNVNDHSFDIYGASFPSNTSGSLYNVRKQLNSGTVNLYGYSGVFSGAAFEMDLFNRINWLGGGLISGIVSYDNSVSTALSNVTVNLMQSGTTVASTTTNSSGYYQFSGVAAGLYNLHCTSLSPWGGSNSVDALLIMKHFVALITLSGIRLIAADVDNNLSVNSIDALLCAKRYTAIISTFPSGDWYIENKIITASGGVLAVDLKGIVFGDVNGSYVPPYKTEPSLNFVRKDVVEYENNSLVRVPVKLAGAGYISSASLILNFPGNQFEIQGVEFVKANENTVYNYFEGSLRISWYSIESVFVNAGETLFSLILKANANTKTNAETTIVDFQIEACPESELSGISAQTLSDIELNYPKLIAKSSGVSISQAIPNPAVDLVSFTVNNSEKIGISCSVYSADGKIAIRKAFDNLSVGSHQLKFDLSGFSQGSYTINFEINAQGGVYSLRRTVILIK